MSACALAHHEPGSRVKWSRFSPSTRKTVIVTGTVLTHDRHWITARMDPDGRIEHTSCGAAVPA